VIFVFSWISSFLRRAAEVRRRRLPKKKKARAPAEADARAGGLAPNSD
jgi:hypothetical protein